MSNEVIAEFGDSGNRFIEIAKSAPIEKLHKSNQNDEWSPANIIHHLADTEAHFYIRDLKILTEEIPETDFFDENVYPVRLKYGKRDVEKSLHLLQSLRESFYNIMSNFTAEEWERKGKNANVGEYPIIALIKKSRTHIKDHLNQLNEAVANS